MRKSGPAGGLKLLLTRQKIARRVRAMAGEINKDFRGRPLHVIGILKGSWVFMADLVRHLELDVTVDFLGFASYGAGSVPSGAIRITKDLETSIEGLDVLVVEDILDTGGTFKHLERFLAAHHPRSLKVVALLNKSSRRIEPVRADYIGRNLPDIHFLRPSPRK
ncbi:MAG: hypoxanthine phosphoribosyltransferase [Acidobacteria bacterium]|nr:MAG: hypoxanthine phosphoribosyltransferase [Acidobacteriota bacterium]